MENLNINNNNNNKEAIAFLMSKNSSICKTDKNYIKELERRFKQKGSNHKSWTSKSREILKEFEDSLINKEFEINYEIVEIEKVLKYCKILNSSVKFDFSSSSSKINTFILTIKNTKDFIYSIYGLNLIRTMVEQNLIKKCIMIIERSNKNNCVLNLHIY